MAASKTDSQSSGSGKGQLGKIPALLLTASMIVGTGLFTSLGAATAQAQSGLLVAMLIGGLIALLTGISASQVGVNYPEEGGAFIWMRIFGHPTLSFAAGIAYLIEGTVGLGILALGFANYSAEIFPGLSIPMAATIALFVVAALNFFGISPTSNLMIGIFLINLVLLGLYVGFSAPSVKMDNMAPLSGPGIAGVLSGAATFFWTWDGFQRTAIMANELKEPRKTIPFAVIGGILIAAVIYVFVAGTTLGVLGARAMGRSDTPLFLGATMAMAGWGIWMIIGSAWMLTVSEMLGDLMSTSRVGHSMGQTHEMPHWLGYVHKRRKSPQYSILLISLVGLILVNLIPVRQLMPVASACTLVWYTTTNFAALKLNKDRRFPWAWPILSWLGIAACITLFLSLPLWSVIGALGFLVLLIGIRWLLLRLAENKAIDAGGSWTVSGLNLSEGDTISVTAQYAIESASTATITIVAAAPTQTAAPVIAGTITSADTTVTGRAPSDSSVILSVNGIAQAAVTATGGNWTVAGLTLAQGDTVSVTAQSAGETVSIPATTTVAAAPLETAQPVISGVVYESPAAKDSIVSGTAPAGADVVLSVNGTAEPPVVATDGNWSVSGLNLAPGDSISVTAKSSGDTVSTATATTTVAPRQFKTAEPTISGIVTAADTTISGKAPAGASIVLSVNGVAQPAVIATGNKTIDTITVAAAPPQTAQPVISGIVTAIDKTVSGTAPAGASIVLSVNGVAQPAVIATGGSWIVSELSLAPGAFISVTAQSTGKTVSAPATISVQ